MLRFGDSPSHRTSMSARPNHIVPPEGQSVVPAPLKPWFASSPRRRRRAALQRAATSSGGAPVKASVRAVPSPSSVRFVTVALANPSLERGPPPAGAARLSLSSSASRPQPAASAQLKRLASHDTAK
jgi:hypothetical protein